MDKILVLATSFLDDLITHPEEEGKASRMLAELAEASGGEIEVAFRCDRDPNESLRLEELERTGVVIADLEPHPRDLLEKIGAANGGPLKLIARYGVGFDTVSGVP